MSVVRGAAERVQDHPVDPAKDGGSGGNTERQGKHCDRCQGRGPAEDARRVPEVFKDAWQVAPAFECNLASDFKSLILFDSEASQVSFPDRDVRKWDADRPASVQSRRHIRIDVDGVIV